MEAIALGQLGLFALEAFLVGSLLLFLFFHRRRYGLGPLFIAVGTMQYLNVVLSLSIYVEVAPGIAMSPGSSVLFTATLFAVLLVYIREDVRQARHLILGVALANVALVGLSSLVALHLESPLTQNYLNLPRELFVQDFKLMVVGTGLLIVDAFLVVVLYESAARVLPRLFFLRAFAALLAVLALDTVLFVTLVFWGEPGLVGRIGAGIAGKTFSAAVLAAAMSLYFQVFRRGALSAELVAAEKREVFEVLTFRERYERMREIVHHDPLTGLYNRGFFDESLRLELARSNRSGSPATLVLLDLDHFKSINDALGHPTGDRVLKILAGAMRDTLRSSEIACRIGGEEFALVLSGTAAAGAAPLVERLRAVFAERIAAEPAPLGERNVTFTAGIAQYPEESQSIEELIRLADRRLYEGKAAGRGRTIGGLLEQAL